jgi:hypothetical protein
MSDAEWDDHFHQIQQKSNFKFEIRKSGIAENKVRPLKERLTRYVTQHLI